VTARGDRSGGGPWLDVVLYGDPAMGPTGSAPHDEYAPFTSQPTWEPHEESSSDVI
jgi:hypothetical protein